MSMDTFNDCLGRAITVGDVLANGQRQGSHGGMSIGIVRGFTERTIVVDALVRDYATQGHPDRTKRVRNILSRTKFSAPYNCCITGMTEEELRKIAHIDE